MVWRRYILSLGAWTAQGLMHLLAGCLKQRSGYDKSVYDRSSDLSPPHPPKESQAENLRDPYFFSGWAVPRGSRYPILKDFGPKNHMVWFFEPETSNLGYLDPFGFLLIVRPTCFQLGC